MFLRRLFCQLGWHCFHCYHFARTRSELARWIRVYVCCLCPQVKTEKVAHGTLSLWEENEKALPQPQAQEPIPPLRVCGDGDRSGEKIEGWVEAEEM